MDRSGGAALPDGASVRLAGPADAPAVADVLIRSRLASVGAIPPPVHSETEIREWVRRELIPGHEVWVTTDVDGLVIAVMALGEGWLDQLYVAPGWTGRGLGSQLLELARSRRPAGLQLWIFATNVRAKRFYERQGFVAVETTDGSGNESNAADIRMVWAESRDSC